MKPHQVIGKRLDQIELNFLVEHLRVGQATPEEIDEIILSHIGLAMHIVNKYAWKMPHLADDMRGAAFLAILKAVERAPKKLVDNNITPFISKYVETAVLAEIADSHVMPGRRYREKIKADPTFIAPKYERLIIPTSKESDRRTYGVKKDWLFNTGDEPYKFDNIAEELDFNERIEQAIMKDKNLKRREFKRVIVRLRAAGYNLEEIAKLIEMSKSNVQLMLSEIEKEYECLNP